MNKGKGGTIRGTTVTIDGGVIFGGVGESGR